MPTGLHVPSRQNVLHGGFATYIVCTKILFIFKISFWFCKEFEWTLKCSMETVKIKMAFLFLLKSDFSQLSDQKFSYQFLPLWNRQVVKEEVEIKGATEM